VKFEAIKTDRLYIKVANQLSRLISDGHIGLGEKFPAERDLAERLGVSRPTIREAMIALEISGLVEIRTGRGIYVSQQRSPQDLEVRDEGPGPFEILEARRCLETETVALAAARITQQQLLELENASQELENEGAEGSVTERADERFHCIIAEASRNSALAATVRWLWQLRNESEISTLFHKRVREQGVHPSVNEHRRIFNALKNRDPIAAKNAMRAHISRALERDWALLDDGAGALDDSDNDD
jgi:DNA-binding FadR family transcriptional regulator